MKFPNPNILIILLLTLLVSSCMPIKTPPLPEATASAPSAPATITTEEAPVQVETPQQAESPITASPVSKENVSSLKEINRAFTSNPQRLVWNQDGSTFAVISQRQVVVFDTQTLTTIAAFSIEEPSQLLDFSSDGKTAAVTTDQTSISFFDVVSNTLMSSIEIPEMVYDAAFSPDGRIIAIALFDEIAATLWDVPGGDIITRLSGFETAAPVYDISFSSDGNSLIWHARGSVQMQDITTAQMGPAFEHEDFVSAIAASPDGSMLATSAAGILDDSFAPLVIIWETTSGLEGMVLNTDSMANNLVFSPDNSLLAGAVLNSLILWDVESGDEVFFEEIAAESISSVSFSPDGSILAVTATDNSIQLWQANS